MEFNLKNWLEEISLKIKERFKERVLFIGYHGSYKRGEAVDSSDIDMVVILDELQLEDLKEYKKIVQSMPHSEKACGFISGKKEIENWSKSDMFQFSFETEALHGNLNEIISPITKEDVMQSVKSSAQVLYHSACHSYLFDKDLKQSLQGLLKMSFFVLQAQFFIQNNEYVPTKKLLSERLSGTDKTILAYSMNQDLLNNADDNKIDELYQILIKWTANHI